MTAIIRGKNITEAQLKRLLGERARGGRPTRGPINPKLRSRVKTIEEVTFERDIEQSFDKAMVLDGWRPIKQEENFSERKKKKTGEAGMADKLYIRYWNSGDPRGPVPGYKTRCYNPQAEVLWIEWKRDRRKRKDQEHQAVWQERERDRGALLWVAGVDFEASIAGAAQHYLASGLARRREIFEALIPGEGRPR